MKDLHVKACTPNIKNGKAGHCASFPVTYFILNTFFNIL